MAGENTAPLSAEDLSLIDPALADTAKDDAELWAEAAAAHDAARAPEATQTAAEPLKVEEEPEAAPAAQEAPVAAAEPAVDIWANATPEQRAALDAMAANQAKLERDVKASIGRAAAAQRRFDQLVREAQPREIAGDPEKAKAVRDKLTAAREDYPELATPIIDALDDVDRKVSVLAEAEDARQATARGDLKDFLDDQQTELVRLVPDFQDVFKSIGRQEYLDWINDQPAKLRKIHIANDAAIIDAGSVAELVEALRAHVANQNVAPAEGRPSEGEPAPTPSPNPSLSERRARQLAASATPQRNTQRPAVSAVPEDADDETLWNAAVARQEAAKRRA